MTFYISILLLLLFAALKNTFDKIYKYIIPIVNSILYKIMLIVQYYYFHIKNRPRHFYEN